MSNGLFNRRGMHQCGSMIRASNPDSYCTTGTRSTPRPLGSFGAQTAPNGSAVQSKHQRPTHSLNHSLAPSNGSVVITSCASAATNSTTLRIPGSVITTQSGHTVVSTWITKFSTAHSGHKVTERSTASNSSADSSTLTIETQPSVQPGTLTLTFRRGAPLNLLSTVFSRFEQ